MECDIRGKFPRVVVVVVARQLVVARHRRFAYVLRGARALQVAIGITYLHNAVDCQELLSPQQEEGQGDMGAQSAVLHRQIRGQAGALA